MFSKILVLSPHTDDAELGCGGSIVRFLEEGGDVFYAALSSCEKSVPPEFPPDILKKEVKKATRVLGIKEGNLLLYDFPVRDFPGHRQGILDVLIEVRERVRPDIVFTPSSFDTHQDHQTVRQETLRAFKKCTILGYEQPWNNITFNTLAFIPLEEKHVERKIRALNCYETQRYRKYLSPDFIRGLADTRGTQLEERFAEAFEVIRWVLR